MLAEGHALTLCQREEKLGCGRAALENSPNEMIKLQIYRTEYDSIVNGKE